MSNTNKQSSSELTIKKLSLTQPSRYSTISTNSSDMSNSLDSSGISSDTLIDWKASMDDFQKPKSRIGNTKEGYWKFGYINPLSRYNFIIDRYNEEINKVNEIVLTPIPFNSYFRFFYDLICLTWRITFGLPIMLVSLIVKHLNPHMYFNSILPFYSYKGNSTAPYRENNLIILILSILLLATLVLSLVFYPVIAFTLPLCGFFFDVYGVVYFMYNKKLIGKNFYKNMIYDENMQNNMLNDYITIIPNTIESFSKVCYYTYLQYLYKKKNTLIPQHFMTYGKLFKMENKILIRSLYINVIALGICVVFFFINY
jgi:hypothetical protein